MSELTAMQTQTIGELENRFNYHAPNDERAARHTSVRQVLLSAATSVVLHTAFSREQSLALTKLEEAMFWANAAIAREQ